MKRIAVSLVALTVFVAIAAPSSAATNPRVGHAHRLWRDQWRGFGNYADADVVASSGDGTRLYVAGNSGEDLALTALQTSTGDRLWRWHGGSGFDPEPADVVVSPDGSVVFVAGSAYFGGSRFDIVVRAHDAQTGRVLWLARYDGVRDGDDDARKVLISPDGSTLYVVGDTFGGGATQKDFLVLAYDASSGALDWSRRRGSGGSRQDIAIDAALSPDGSSLFVQGEARMSDIPFDADEMVLALNALEGTVIWSQRLGVNRKFYRNAGGVAVSGDGSRVYAASTAPGPGKTDGFETIAFDADSGGRVWTSTTGPADGVLSDIALADGGSAIVEVGADYPAQSTENIALALDTQTGHLAWQRTFLARGGEFGYLQQVAVSSDGSVAYAAGFSCPDPDCNESHFMSAFALATVDGATEWEGNVGEKANAHEADLSVSADGSAVIVVGDETSEPGHPVAVVVAFSP